VSVFGCSRHETEPTVLVLVDRRHGSWSSVKSILHVVGVSHIAIHSVFLSFKASPNPSSANAFEVMISLLLLHPFNGLFPGPPG